MAEKRNPQSALSRPQELELPPVPSDFLGIESGLAQIRKLLEPALDIAEEADTPSLRNEVEAFSRSVSDATSTALQISDHSLSTWDEVFIKDHRRRISAVFRIAERSLLILFQKAPSIQWDDISKILTDLSDTCHSFLDNKIFELKEETNPFVTREAFTKRMVQDLRDGFEKYSSKDYPASRILQDMLDELGLSSTNPKPIALPSAPPEGQLFHERKNRSETAPEFIARVYGPWLTGELTRADLRKLDRSADYGLYNWEAKHGRASILNLPTRQERNTRLLAETGAKSRIETEGKELARLRSAAWRRDKSEGPT